MGALDGTSSVRASFHRYSAEVDNIRVAVAHAIDDRADRRGEGDRGRHVALRRYSGRRWRCASGSTRSRARRRGRTAARAAGVHAFLAFIDADIGAMERLIAAVPSEYHNNVSSLMNVMWLAEAFGRGDVDAADAITGAYRPRTEYERFMVTNQAVMGAYTRMRLGDLDAGLVQRTRRDAAALVDRAKASGDEIAIAMALQSAALVHVYSGELEKACAPAAEAIVVADSIGAGVLADAGRIALGIARAGMAKSGERGTGARGR